MSKHVFIMKYDSWSLQIAVMENATCKSEVLEILPVYQFGHGI
jgi:hypothetical protein